MKCHRFCRGRGRRGFTLAEIMITVVIAGLILAFGLPRMANHLRVLTARSATAQVVTDLTLARTQAVREGSRVAFTVTGPASYRVSVVDAAGTEVRRIKAVTVDGAEARKVGIAPAGATVTFDSRGIRNSGDGFQGFLVVTRGASTDTVEISPVGRVYRVRAKH
jgi:prepilin-type N-terminal cleavage/methylation domain-containing protein